MSPVGWSRGTSISSVNLTAPDGRTLPRSPSCASPLEKQRAQSAPALPEVLEQPHLRLEEAAEEIGAGAAQHEEVARVFPDIAGLRLQRIVAGDDSSPGLAAERSNIGIASVSNAVAASGTTNVILGLARYLSTAKSAGSVLWGIRSLTKGDEFAIDMEEYSYYLNQAGSDLLPPVPLSRLSERILGQMAKVCDRLQLSGLVFLCGPSELTEVAQISQHFAKQGMTTVVTAVIHSLSGWVQLPGWIPANLGFDSASSILAEAAGNIALSRESLDRDIYHFVACGSSPLTLEVAMQIHPTLCYIGVDVAQRGLSLQEILDEICDVIVERHHEHGLHSGVIMVSDDFFELLSEMRQLQQAIHRLRSEKPADMRSEESAQQLLPPDLQAFFTMMPADVRGALVFRTGIDGLPMLKFQEAERELGALVARRLAARGAAGGATVARFVPQPHSLRHLAWSPMPTPLDCALGYALGHIAGVLVQRGANGYVASVSAMDREPARWCPCAVPMVRLLEPGPSGGPPAVQRRRLTPENELCALWLRVRDLWRYRHSCRQPGPVQFWGPGGDRPLAWATYTLRVLYTDPEVLAREAGMGVDLPAPLPVPLGRLRKLARRCEALLSPLQKWRASYQASLPKVLRSRFRLVEHHRKGRVCADPALMHRSFPNLCRTDNLKAIKIESVPDEVSVLSMLPARPPRLQTDGHHSLSTGSLGYPDASPRRRGTDGEEYEPSVHSSSCHDTTGARSDFGALLRGTDSRVGIAVIGKPGPGVNNVIHGLIDYLNLPQRALPGTLVCIAMGIAGLTSGHSFELDAETFALYCNQGGCDMLGQSEPGDLKTMGDFAACAKTVTDKKLDGLVIWGGRNVHAWTVRLAEYFAEHKVSTRVVAVPASTQSDLPMVEQTLGYDSVCKMYASLVGNLATQAASSGKLWCFARIPGRSISHIAAEVALETHPHVVLMAAELEQQNLGLTEVTQLICNIIETRSREDKQFGVVLIPDQFLASVREMRRLFEEIDQILQACPEAREAFDSHDFGMVLGLLPPLSRALFQSFPERTKAQILGVIDEGGSQKGRESLDLSFVETEVIFQSLVETELTRRVVLGTYKGTFRAITYSLPYHGRAAMPTNFDCDLGYTIGYTAGVFVDSGYHGLLVDVSKLKEDVQDWEIGGTPLPFLLTLQDAPAQSERPLAHKIEPKSRLHYDIGLDEGQIMPEPSQRTLISPGPAQFEGPCAGLKTQTLRLPQLQRVRQMERTQQLIEELKAKASAGCPPEVLQAVKRLLKGGTDLLRQL